MIADVSTHWCGGTLLFVREPSRSVERCRTCGWLYDFDHSRASDARALVGWTRG